MKLIFLHNLHIFGVTSFCLYIILYDPLFKTTVGHDNEFFAPAKVYSTARACGFDLEKLEQQLGELESRHKGTEPVNLALIGDYKDRVCIVLGKSVTDRFIPFIINDKLPLFEIIFKI